jgi:hypothetical protein
LRSGTEAYPASFALHVLLDDALLPARGDVAEVGVEQVVHTHRGEAGVDRAALTLVDPAAEKRSRLG